MPGRTDPSMPAAHALDRLLGHLHLAREAPSLEYLHRLIAAHQRGVPFETLTKLIDYEPGLRRGNFLPDLDDYVDRMVTRGAGGLCWTLARGFKALLDDLGFDAAFMYMAPGHCCVRVELPEGPFYADVGYAAPLFQAYPLFESFSIKGHREAFEYRVEPDGVVVTRNPGPSKTLDPTPRPFADLEPMLVAANDWATPHSFLHRLTYSREVDGVYTSLRDGLLVRHLPGGAVQQRVADSEAPDVLADVFGADPSLYREAAEVHRRYSPGRAPWVRS